MRLGLSSLLRLVGPLIEISCFFALFRIRGRDYRVLNFPLEYLLYFGIAVGLACVFAGIALSRVRRNPRSIDEWDQPRKST